MRFGPVPLSDAAGAILAHSVRLADGRLKKGTVLDEDAVARLQSAGHDTVVCAVLEKGDVGEDAAAGRIATAVAGAGVRADPPATGRANLFAAEDGVLTVDATAVARLNAVDEAITLATLAPNTRVAAGQMVATAKIIPYAVAGASLDAAAAVAVPPLAVAPFCPLRVALITTRIAGDKDSVVAKRRAAVADRVTALGGTLVRESTVDHTVPAVTGAIDGVADADVILIFGAVAISDRDDVIPAALVAAGGVVERLGMPVDPGNLALVGRLGDRPAIGVPSCAASPKLNGFDWILERLFAGLPVTSDGVGTMGVGGLLAEIPTRPRLRADRPKPATGRIVALILAAGRSSRMGQRFKLVEDLDGTPIVRHVADAARASAADAVIVVTGHRASDVETALDGADVGTVHNPDFVDGLASSLRAGLAAAADAAAVIVFLGDMPLVGTGVADALIAAHRAGGGRAPCVPTHDGRRGNPVLWPAAYFEALAALDGDRGARSLLNDDDGAVIEVPVETDAIFVDIDTAEALDAVRNVR